MLPKRRITKFFYAALAAAVMSLPFQAEAQQIIHVNNAGALQQALDTVPHGGIVELAAGNYDAPNGAFTIYGGTKGFTIRAAAGASVSLNGRGATDILRFTDSTHAMTFERLTFINGATQSPFLGGALTLVNVQASIRLLHLPKQLGKCGNGRGRFVDCTGWRVI